jgi:asparagine synthase (glutamine-hydrolysing)
MSGIFGVFHFDGAMADRALMDHMAAFMRPSGPDGAGTWVDGPIGLGRTLLRTRDEVDEQMGPATLDGAYCGGHRRPHRRARRPALGARRSGAKAACERRRRRPGSRAYRRWGADCVNHFLGDFAFAIWDARGKDCFVRAIISGSVHSFYALNETRFAFASVLNVVRRFPGVGDHLDDLAVADFLLFDHNQDPRSTTLPTSAVSRPRIALKFRGRG